MLKYIDPIEAADTYNRRTELVAHAKRVVSELARDIYPVSLVGTVNRHFTAAVTVALLDPSAGDRIHASSVDAYLQDAYDELLDGVSDDDANVIVAVGPLTWDTIVSRMPANAPVASAMRGA